LYQILPIADFVAVVPPMPGDAICCEEFGHELQPKSPSAKLGKLSSFDFLASCVGIAPSWGMVMRLFAATLATETNTFSPLPTSLASYRDTVFPPPGEHPEDAPRMCTAQLFVARRRAHSDGFTLLESDAPLSRDDRQIEYVKVNRTIWPLDENTRPRLIF
jgi:hypothetical protein